MESLDLFLSTSPTLQLQPVEAAPVPPIRHEVSHDHQWTSKQQRNKDLRIKTLNKLAIINSTNPPNFTGNKVVLNKLSSKSIEHIQNIFPSTSDKRQEGKNNDMHDHVKNDQPLLPSTVAPKSSTNHRKSSDNEHNSPLGINKDGRGMWKKQILENYLKSKTATQTSKRDSSHRHDHDDASPKHAKDEDFSSRRSSKRPMVQLDHHVFDDDHADDCVMLDQPPPLPSTRKDIPQTLNLFPEVPELASSSSRHDHQEEDVLTLSLFPTYPRNTCI